MSGLLLYTGNSRTSTNLWTSSKRWPSRAANGEPRVPTLTSIVPSFIHALSDSIPTHCETEEPRVGNSNSMTTSLSQRSRRDSPAPGATNVAIIGAGRGGTALMEILANDPLVQIVGVAELSPDAPGLGLAKQL